MNSIFKTLAATALAATLSVPALAEDKTITIGTMSWEDLTPITGIAKSVLEQQGYTVEVEEFSEWGIAFAALTKGDVDIMASQTDYVAHDYWLKNMKKLEKISPVSHGLYQAIAVPSYVTINSMDELAGVKDQFGGKIIGIEPGSGLMRDAASAVDAYGFDMELVEGSTAAMTAALDSAMSRNEWIAVTVWEPSWMMQKYDVKFLADPKGVFPTAQSYYFIGTAGFSAENPHTRELLASIYVPLADITAINGAMNDGKSLDEAVSDWVVTHEDLVTRWTDIKAD